MKFRLGLSVLFGLLCQSLLAQYVRVDPSFDVKINGDVWALALQPDGKILIGGHFANVNGAFRGKIARLHSDGSLDETFVPEGEVPLYDISQIVASSSNICAAIPGVGARRYDLTGVLELTYPAAAAFVIDSQRRQVFGAVTEWQRWDRVGRFNEDGSRDSNFWTRVDWCCLNRGVDTVAIQNHAGQEKFLIGGKFGDVNGYENWGLARLNEDGSTDTNFHGNAPGPIVAIDLLNNGMFFAATRLSVGRYFADGTPDLSFTNLSFSYHDYYRGVKADKEGGVIAWGSGCSGGCVSLIRRFNSDGTLDTNFSVYLNGLSPLLAVAVSDDGSILIAGRFTEVNCIPRTYLARLIPSDTPDPLPCVPPPPPPPKPEPELTTSRLRPAKMVCCWPTNYPEYTLQATRRLRPRNPEKEKWHTVTNTPVIGESTICVTNRIARWGRHYRLVKE